MLCLEAGAWNTGPRLLLGILSTSPPSLRSLLSAEAGLSSLRGLVPAVPRSEHPSRSQFGLHISASPVPVVHFFCGPGPTHPPAALLYPSNQTRGKRQPASTVLTAPWRAGGESTEPWLEGMAFNLFLLRFPPLGQFSFPACGISHSLPPVPDLCPPQGGAGSKRRGWDLVLCNWFLFIIWITARNQNKD